MKNTIVGVDLAKDVIQVCVYANKKVQASLLPDIYFIEGKNIKQQQLQSMLRLRELAVRQRTASGNQLKALLLEFNIRISTKNGGLKGTIESVLEDSENGLSMVFRQALDTAWNYHLKIVESIHIYDGCLEKSIEEHADCQRLLKLEGVGIINAINLYIALGCAELGRFTKGKDASACIGLTPIQYSSGGKVKQGSIGRYVKNSLLRSQLITGAMAVVAQVTKRTAVTKKEAWIQGLVARRGKKCAAVALANKTVRTAFALLSQGSEYKAELLAA